MIIAAIIIGAILAYLAGFIATAWVIGKCFPDIADDLVVVTLFWPLAIITGVMIGLLYAASNIAKWAAK